MSETPEKQLETSLHIIGERIRTLRKERGYSQESFAYHAGLNRGYMGKIERGENNVTIGTLLLVCNALSIKMEKLTEGIPVSLKS